MSEAKWQVITGDCLAEMAKFGPGEFDAVITDPPYNFQKDIENDDILDDAWRKLIADAARGMYRALRLDSFLLTDFPRKHLPIVCGLFEPFEYRDVVTAFVINSMARCAWGVDRFTPSFVFAKGNPKVKHIWSNVVQVTRTSNGKGWTGHPTQKYLDAYKKYVAMITDPGATILDPFCGSGTTGVACVELGRNFVGIELDPGYADIARKRIDAAARQGRMF